MLGVPAVIALGLVYWVTTLVDYRLVQIQMVIDKHVAQQELATQRLQASLYAICLKGDVSETDRARCAIAFETNK